MTAEMNGIVTELHERARQRAWQSVIAATSQLLDGTASRPIVLAVATAIDAAPLSQWIERNTSKPANAWVALASLEGEPLAGAAAQRVVAVFSCTEFPQAPDLDALNATLFNRPAGTFAVVLIGADRLQTAADLDAVQKLAGGLFVPSPSESSDSQNLVERHVYLWCDGALAGSNAARLENDRSALLTWLNAPLADALKSELNHQRIACALAQAAQELFRRDQGSEVLTTPSPARVFDLRNQLVTARQRHYARTSSTWSDVEHSLQVNLNTLSHDLRDGFRAHLAAMSIPRLDADADGEWLGQTLEAYVGPGLDSWYRKAGDLVEATGRQWLEELTNTLAPFALSIGPGGAPQPRSSGGLSEDGRNRLKLILRNALSQRPGLEIERGLPLRRAGATGLRSTVRALVGAAVGAGVGSLVPLVPYGMVVGGIAGAVAVNRFDRASGQADALSAMVEHGRRAIQKTLEEVDRLMRERRAEMNREMKAVCETEFDALERLFETPPAGSEELQVDRQAIQDWQERLRAAI